MTPIFSSTLFKIAGVSGDGRLDPGETWNDANSNGIVDIGEDSGDFVNLNGVAPFWLTPRVGVNQVDEGDLTQYTIVYLANVVEETSGVFKPQGLYASNIDITDFLNPVITDPVSIIKVGDQISGVSGNVT